MTTSTVVQKVQAVQTVQTLRSVQIVQAQAATPAGATLRLLQLVIDFKIKVGNISPTDLFRDWYAGACLAVLTALRFHRICRAGVLRGAVSFSLRIRSWLFLALLIVLAVLGFNAIADAIAMFSIQGW
jgi:hypothetical protein